MRPIIRNIFLFLAGIFGILLIWFMVGPSILRGPLEKPGKRCGLLAAEGWLPEPVLNAVADIYTKGCYRKLLVTGVTLPDEVEMLFRGRLIMYPSGLLSLQPGATLYLKMRGTKVSGERAAGHVWLNDTLVGAFTSPRRAGWVALPVGEYFPAIESIGISFDNDAWTQYADRNLYIYAVRIKGKEYLPRSMRAIYIRYLESGVDTVALNFSSVPGQAAWFLHRFGIPENQMDVIAVQGIHSDKTWHSMKALAEFVRYHYPADSSLVIVTHPFHARRTWMLARKAFSPSVDVSVITPVSSRTWWKSGNEIKMFIKESAGLFWACLRKPALH